MKTIKVSEKTYELIKDQLVGEEVKPLNNLEDLIGQTYVFQCARYIYHGTVKAITSDYIELEDASVVFETGDYSNTSPSDMQALPHNAHIMRQSVEAFYKMKW